MKFNTIYSIKKINSRYMFLYYSIVSCKKEWEEKRNRVNSISEDVDDWFEISSQMRLFNRGDT